jgi:phosphoglucomutase
LVELLDQIYAKYGYFSEKLQSITLKGIDGAAQIQQIMSHWRANPPQTIAGFKVVAALDYNEGIDGLPKENVLKYRLENHSWFCLRPSGTEPKIKFYFAVQGHDSKHAQLLLSEMMSDVNGKVEQNTK